VGSIRGFGNKIQSSRMLLKIYFPVSKLLILQLIANVRNSSSHKRMGAARIVSKGGQPAFQCAGEPE
jgi:hypothetical protein